jgi:Protein of unknown function (DUF3617)
MRLSNRSSFFVLCAAAALLAGPSTLLAQLSDLPVKAGLWETHVSTRAGASTMDAGAAQFCFTAGTTLGEYLTATNQGVAGTKCNVSKKANAPHGLSYDTVCNGRDVASNGHIDVQLRDAEHFSGSSHTTVTGSAHGKPLNMAIDKTFTAKFLSSDCGNVKPFVVAAPHAN